MIDELHILYFKTPTPVNEDSTSSVSIHTSVSDNLRRARLAIWDESDLSHLHKLQVVHRTLRDIAGSSILIGWEAVLY